MRRKNFKKRFLSALMVVIMAFAMVVSNFGHLTVEAANDTFSLGAIVYDENGVASYPRAVGTGTTKYYSIVIGFTQIMRNNESIVLPTVSGFTYSSSISTAASKIVNMSGGKTLGECADYIRQVKFYNLDENGQGINISIQSRSTDSKTLYYEGTKHYYQYIKFASKGEKTWKECYTLAMNSTYDGMKGYLATVTDKNEDLFLYEASNHEVGWLGGTRMVGSSRSGQYYTGTFNTSSLNTQWAWACGPEIGTTFFDYPKTSYSNYGTQAAKGYYFNWDVSSTSQPEPNNGGTGGPEYCLTTLGVGRGYQTGSSYAYSWNDLANQSGTSGNWAVQGYFVEYGDQPNGNSTQSSSSNTVTVAQSIPKLTHEWEYLAGTGEDANKLYIYCTLTEPECVYHGTQASHDNALVVTLDVEDHIYDRQRYDGARLLNGDRANSVAGTVVGDVSYYSVSTKGATSGGILLTQPPKDVGYYYASATVNGQTLVKAFQIYRDPANYAMENLNNLQDEEGKTLKKVSGESATDGEINANLRVHLTDPGDTITLYKVADMKWNSTNSDYDDLTWVEAVANWRESTSYVGALYDSPNALASASNSKWTDFYSAMMKGEGNAVDRYGLTALFSHVERTEGDGDTAVTLFENLTFGTYVIMAKSAADTPYNPVVVNIVPDRTGPWESYYISYEFEAYLKDSEATISKTINGAEVDTVHTGEVVDFEVEIGMPTLYKDRVTLSTDSGVKDYSLYLEDVMSPAFTYTGDPPDIKVMCHYEGAPAEGVDLSNEVITYYQYADASYVATSGETKLAIPTGGIQGEHKYYYDNTFNAELERQYYVEKIGNLYTIEPISTTTDEKGQVCSVIRIHFNVPALKAWVNNVNNHKSITSVTIQYQATVTEDAKVASDDNYNKAAIFYEKNSTGTNVGSVDATVRAYTYGMNLVKIDGATDGTDSPKYLDGAIFNLYKEQYIYLMKQKVQDTDSDPEPVLVKRLDHSDDPITKTIEDFKADNTTYYVYEVELENDMDSIDGFVIAELDDFTETLEEGDTIVRIFEKKEQISSVASAAGLTITGLDVGSYILEEETAPEGYNRLAEDMMFTIGRLSEEDSQSLNRGGLSSFYEIGADNSKTMNDTGIFAVKVLNYAGLSLPSTGGIGTLIFTIIGVTIMGVVLVVIIVKMKNRKE